MVQCALGRFVGVRRATALIGDAMPVTAVSEGRSGAVETGLTEPVAMALYYSECLFLTSSRNSH